MRKLLITGAGLLCLVFSVGAFAQTSNATLGGTVSDSTGASIPGVAITATNIATGIVNTVLTNEVGAYQFASLQTGTYKVTGELAGFRTQTYNEVLLGISQQVRLNFTLQVGSVAQSVDVTVAADTLIATSSSSVGTVLPEYKVRDLPLGGRNVMDLLTRTAGVSNAISGDGTNTGSSAGDIGFFAGGRLGAVNTTRDGFVVSDGRYLHGAFSSTYVSPDLVEEVRVITAPVDAEMGRGSGQVQMSTRSGTNLFRGSLFWNNRNSALDASNWFNNFNGVPKDYENRNQFRGRLGGPIIKNKTFFFVLIDEQRDLFKQTFVGTTLTPLARQGVFRFFPGADNQNATQNNPTVDRNGNPVRPAGATGDLQQFSVFGRDSSRPGYDPSGFIQNTLLSKMPQPNDYTVGDGLNTAGIRFTRRISGMDLADGNGYDTNRDQFNTRIDHHFNTNHKLSFTATYERGLNHTTQAGIRQWPDGYDGANNKWPRIYNGSFVSTLSATTVNELRIGYRNTRQASWTAYYVGRPLFNEGEPVEPGLTAFKILPQSNGIPYLVNTTLFPENLLKWSASNAETRQSNSPLYSYADNISWTRGTHAFKVGGELRFASSRSGSDTNFTPRAVLGAGGVAVTGIDNLAFPGLTGNNQTAARNLLTDLSGSVASIVEAFDLRDPKDLVFRGYKDGVKLQIRDWRTTEFSLFIKDAWKVRPSLTLNYGVHYEWFGVPYEGKGLAGAPVNREKGLCGISCGAITAVEFVGRNSPNAGKQMWGDDWNNFAPSFGLSWSLPWLGKDRTVLRAGYGWSYTGSSLNTVALSSVFGRALPGTFAGSVNNGLSYTSPNYLSLSNLSLPIPQQFAPLEPVPLDGSRNETIPLGATNRVAPYIQNFNLEIMRDLGHDMALSVAYVGTKGTRLWGGIPLNSVDIFNNGFLDAFNTTRAGGSAKLFDDMLGGLNLGSGTINGTTVTGSASLRANTNTRAFIANGSVAQLADFLNRSTNVTGKGGGFVRNSRLFPESFFVLNPQFQFVTYHGNPGNSTYHSLQLELVKRLSNGFTNQTQYTWSRAIGENDGDATIDYRDPNNRSQNKALLGYHRTHMFSTNGTYELPFGPGRPLLSNAPRFVQRLAERWQLGGIFSWTSGAPLNITTPLQTVTNSTSATSTNPVTSVTVTTPDVVGDFPKSFGKVTKVANGVTYFPGIQQINDPSLAGVTTANGLNGQFSNKAIADSQGRLLLVNPVPGRNGTLGLKWVEGPPLVGFDANLIKRVRMTETKEFEFRIDVVNVLNHPVFSVPLPANLSINSTSFGRITLASGNRRFTMGARLNF